MLLDDGEEELVVVVVEMGEVVVVVVDVVEAVPAVMPARPLLPTNVAVVGRADVGSGSGPVDDGGGGKLAGSL